ncbi:MAG: biotin-dependent carboxyltransferase [Synergistetes bacterium]|nr:biotin-dependent carboxyltransferase [Synergistota bacterium]
MIEIISPGLLTTVQDLGRFGFQAQGISTAGAMDEFALRVANALVGNPQGEACLEITLSGPSISFEDDAIIAITGGDLGPCVNGNSIPMWESVYVRKGSVLSFSGIKWGARAYIAFQGGILVERVMGSKSTDLKARIGGIGGRALKKGDKIGVGLPLDRSVLGRRFPRELLPPYSNSPVLRVVLGPEDDHFTQEAIDSFFSQIWVVGDRADRMGYRLEGEPLKHSEKGAEIISDGIALGSVQVPKDGKPIVLLKDRQAVGGYSKIATVISVDIPLIAQLKTGDKLSFKEISLKEAVKELEERERLLSSMSWGGALRRASYRIRIGGEEVIVEVEEL